MSSSKKLDELTELAMMLQLNEIKGVTIDEMCERLERPRRAIERMMEVLKDKFGGKLTYKIGEYDRKKHWSLKKGSMSFMINFSDSEIAKLEMLKNKAINEEEKKIISNIIDKIRVLNPAKSHKTDIDVLLESYGYAVMQQPKEIIKQDIMEKIALAILSQKKLKLDYKNSYGEEYQPIIEPYGIKISILGHYLIAKEEEKVKTFKICRIKSIESVDEYYCVPDDFNMQEYCNLSFGVYKDNVENVVLKFSESAAIDAMNYNFHPTQTFEPPEKDGSVIMKFQASGRYEIITELLKWRDGVEVVAPQILKEEYIQTVKQMYKKI